MIREAAKKEMADAVFGRGAAAFAEGRYQDTIKELTLCISMDKSDEYQHLDTDAYNMLGMLFLFSGYETSALDYYFSALESSKKRENLSGAVSSLLNIGLLYQGCKEYSKAMSYYKQARTVAEQDLRSNDMLLMMYADIQIAQLHCRMGQFSEARHIYQKIEDFYGLVMRGEHLLPKYILDILLEHEAGNDSKVRMLADDVIGYLRNEEQFVEQLDFYIDICELMSAYGNVKETKELLRLIWSHLKDTDFLRLKMRLQQIAIDYSKNYGSEEDYKEACRRYIDYHDQYERALLEFQKENLENIDGMQKLEAQKREFERRSRSDMATGLLNKKAFRHDVEQSLLEHSGATMNAMLFLDIDNFKLINDSYGHLLGDEVIRTLADKIKAHFNEDCICGRFGGDEFTVFVKSVEDLIELESKVEEFREAFAKTGFGQNGSTQVTLSIGVSYNQGMRVSYQAMLSCADEALEKAKEYGKNRVSFYEIKRGIYNYV